MKLVVLQEKLKEGLGIIERASGKSLSLPVLNNTLIRAEKSLLCLMATDLELGIKWWTLAKIEKGGEVVVPTRLLSSIVSLLPDKQINIEEKEGSLLVECLNFKNQIKGFSSEDFPIIPEVSGERFAEINSSSFCQGLSQVVDFATPSQARPEISGIFLSFQEGLVRMASTDSFRLGEKTLTLEKIVPSHEGISFIIPQKTAREVVNVFAEKPGKLKIYFSPNQALFECQMAETPRPQIQLSSRLIEGEYPVYQEIIPKKYETQITLSRSYFLNQVKIASLFGGKTNEIRFKINSKKEEIEIFSQSPDLGQHQSFLGGKVKGQAVEASFNYRFLSDGLLTIKSSEVLFELNGEDGPAVLRPVGDQSYLYVVMPIKTV